MAYATTSTVPVDRTRAEIEREVVTKHKCQQYSSGMDFQNHTAMIQFKTHDRIVRFVLTLPDPNKFYQSRKFQQAERTLWRAFLLVIKAKLEAVESKIATFEQEFMANIVMPNDRTIEEIVTPLIARAYETRTMPQGLLAAPQGNKP